MAQETNSTIENLVKALSSFNDLSRVEARKALVAIGKPAVPSLIEALKDANKLRRWKQRKPSARLVTPTQRLFL